jgi:uncharacterized protein (TIGR02646 family)
MILVKKPAAPPILAKPKMRGARETKRLCDAHDAGERAFKFEAGVYGAKSVKNALVKAQHSKCAFCESKFTHVAYGDVEHFRPKGGWVQAEGDELTQPGYYWLAYDWANLYASCQLCNQRFKRNLFPILDPGTRCRSHRGDLAAEAPLLIDPGGAVDPATLIGFREEYPYPIDDSASARSTIAMLGLDREELAEARRDALKSVALILKSIRAFEEMERNGTLTLAQRDHLIQLRVWLDDQTLDSAQYASMRRAAIAKGASD